MTSEIFFHPKLVHLPIALALVIPLIAGGVLLAWRRGWYPRRVWVVVLVLQAILVAGAFLAMRTGEQQEERVERVVAEEHIEAHEEAAEVFTWTSVGVLVMMILALLVPTERARLTLGLVSLLGTLVALALAVRTGDAGGALVYEHGAAGAYTHPGGGGPGGDPPNAESDGDDEELDD